AIIVDESASCSPCFAGSGDAGLFSHFGEDSVLIVVETVLAVVGDVEVFPSVVVVVADAHALAPSGCGETGFGSDVGEGAVVIVAVEVVGGSLSGGSAFKFGAVDQE